jgi:hypothetical protein
MCLNAPYLWVNIQPSPKNQYKGDIAKEWPIDIHLISKKNRLRILRAGVADLDPYVFRPPDPYQNVTDPEHCFAKVIDTSV